MLLTKYVITFKKYPLFHKVLQYSLTLPTGSVKSERLLVHCSGIAKILVRKKEN